MVASLMTSMKIWTIWDHRLTLGQKSSLEPATVVLIDYQPFTRSSFVTNSSYTLFSFMRDPNHFTTTLWMTRRRTMKWEAFYEWIFSLKTANLRFNGLFFNLSSSDHYTSHIHKWATKNISHSVTNSKGSINYQLYKIFFSVGLMVCPGLQPHKFTS